VCAATAADRAAVVSAARARADALAAGDVAALTDLLHERFRWTAHTGAIFDRDEYVRRNTSGTTVWRSQDLVDAEVTVVGDTAVLHAEVTDVVDGSSGEPETFRMPMTQVWVRHDGRWRCLAGHAGPRRTQL
jgi:ketosteroid isomerase-like protein